VTISLQSSAGSKNTSAIVGMVLFCQFWYWYPLAHCACLAFNPTAIIGVNGDLQTPKLEFISNAKPSLFAYPSSTKPAKKEAIARVATAVLSTTAKVKAREKKKAAAESETADVDEKKDGDVEMNTDEPTKHGDVSPISGSISNLVDTSKPPSRKKEASSERLQNFSRVTPQQLTYISFPPGSRYQPVRPVSTNSVSRPKKSSTGPLETYTGVGGILVLLDEQPDEPVDLIAPLEPSVVVPEPTATQPAQPVETAAPRPHIALDEDSPEASPPAPFEYPFGNDS